jgi:hypothetical protein
VSKSSFQLRESGRANDMIVPEWAQY